LALDKRPLSDAVSTDESSLLLLLLEEFLVEAFDFKFLATTAAKPTNTHDPRTIIVILVGLLVAVEDTVALVSFCSSVSIALSISDPLSVVFGNEIGDEIGDEMGDVTGNVTGENTGDVTTGAEVVVLTTGLDATEDGIEKLIDKLNKTPSPRKLL
jgi:hypothetical protein